MVLTREQELWGVALWVETNHGDRGSSYIAGQIERLALQGDDAGVDTVKNALAHASILCEPIDACESQFTKPRDWDRSRNKFIQIDQPHPLCCTLASE